MSSVRLIRFSNRILAFWKWSLSFRTYDWKLSDYPVRIRKAEIDQSVIGGTRFRQLPYSAYIINWAVIGSGDTPEQATENLNQNFESIKRECLLKGERLVRPGVRRPPEFASQANVSSNQELSEDFIQRVLGLEWAWISDESSLWDFHTDQNNDLLHEKIREIYGVDVSDIESAKLWEILERIKIVRRPSTEDNSSLGR